MRRVDAHQRIRRRFRHGHNPGCVFAEEAYGGLRAFSDSSTPATNVASPCCSTWSTTTLALLILASGASTGGHKATGAASISTTTIVARRRGEIRVPTLVETKCGSTSLKARCISSPRCTSTDSGWMAPLGSEELVPILAVEMSRQPRRLELAGTSTIVSMDKAPRNYCGQDGYNDWSPRPPQGGAGRRQWTPISLARCGAIEAANDNDRNMWAVRDAVNFAYNGNPIQRVLYTENHDEVPTAVQGFQKPSGRVPRGITRGSDRPLAVPWS